MKNLNVNVQFALGDKVGTTGWISNYIQNLELSIRTTKDGYLNMYYTEKGKTPSKSHFLCGQMSEQLEKEVRTGILQDDKELAVIWECKEAKENLNGYEEVFIEHATPAGEKLIWKFLITAADYLADFIENYDNTETVDTFELTKKTI